MNPAQARVPGDNSAVLMETGNPSPPGQSNNNGPLTMTFHSAAEQNQPALNGGSGTSTNNDVSRPNTNNGTHRPTQSSSAPISAEQSNDIYMHTGRQSLEKDFLDLSVEERLKCMRNFWAARQDTFYFRLRFIRELQSNATLAMTRLFDGSTLDRKMDPPWVEKIPRGGSIVYVSGYKWPGVQNHVKAQGPTEDIATRNAAIEALKVIMSENEFNLVCLFCSNKIYEGVQGPQVQELLRFEKNSPTAQPDPVVLAPATGNPDDDYFLRMTKNAFIKLPQTAKEDFVLSYWRKIFSWGREDKFPRVHQLFDFYNIEDNAARAFFKLFNREEIKNGSFSVKKESFSTDEDESEVKYSCTLAWNVGERRGTKTIQAYTPYGAENLAGILALREILGPLYGTIVHMSQPHFYSGLNFWRVQFELLELIQSDSAEEVATNPEKRLKMESAKEESACVVLEKLLAAKGQPPPKYKISEAYAVRCTVRDHTFESVYRKEKDAKNMASFQALEFLWGGKLHI